MKYFIMKISKWKQNALAYDSDSCRLLEHMESILSQQCLGHLPLK